MQSKHNHIKTCKNVLEKGKRKNNLTLVKMKTKAGYLVSVAYQYIFLIQCSRETVCSALQRSRATHLLSLGKLSELPTYTRFCSFFMLIRVEL